MENRPCSMHPIPHDEYDHIEQILRLTMGAIRVLEFKLHPVWVTTSSSMGYHIWGHALTSKGIKLLVPVVYFTSHQLP